jgi:hypothetical protein
LAPKKKKGVGGGGGEGGPSICGKEFKSYYEQEMGERNRSNKRLIGPSRDMKGGYD